MVLARAPWCAIPGMALDVAARANAGRSTATSARRISPAVRSASPTTATPRASGGSVVGAPVTPGAGPADKGFKIERSITRSMASRPT